MINDRPLEEVVREWQGKSRYGDLKKQVASSVEKLLTDFQANYANISDADVEKLLPEGEAYANEIANVKLSEVYQKVGLR